MKGIGYIYLTTNLLNGKQYVGQHLSNCFDTTYKGSGTYIKRAIDKYGWNNFSCEIICWCSTQTQLNEAEDNYIRLLDTMSPNGYNLKRGGSNGEYSKEAKKNCSEAAKKHWENEDNRLKMSETMKKYFESEEGIKDRKKHSEFVKSYFANENNRKKMSDAQKRRFTNPEERKKTSEASKNYYANEDNRKKMSEIKKNYYKSEEGIEHLKKYGETMKKYWGTEENRKKQSERLKNNPKQSKKVYQYTLDGKFVKEWCSAKEIGRELGYDVGCISRCCNGKQKSAYDYFWTFEPLTKELITFVTLS